jgi:SNF2 family DNA or RNA helicase
VAIRLKRWFAKVSKHSHNVFHLSATAENARDLESFIHRYPMDIEQPDVLDRLAHEHRERQTLVESLIEKRTEMPPFNLAIPLREYQEIPPALVLANNGLLLADDVGLGKSAAAIGLMARTETLPALVVTLTHLPLQWRDEIKKFAPNLNVHIIRKGQPYDIATWGRRRKMRNQPELAAFPDVVIINYHKLSGWTEVLSRIVKTVIYDECQEVRKSGSMKYAAARAVSDSVTYRMSLSATPFYNYGAEMWNVMECTSPGALGTHEEFQNEWCLGEKIKDPVAFGTYLRESGLMLRRTRKDVGRELPGLTTIPYTVEADVDALEEVEIDCAHLAEIIVSQQGELFRGQKMQAGGELDWRLRRATGLAKAPYVAEFVRLLAESGEKVVLYGWHRDCYEMWLKKLKDLKPILYTGSESPTQKEAAKQAFINGDANPLIISLRAGAGLDGLQKVSRTVVFGELDWSPGVMEQCVGRVARDGQEQPVMAYYLVCESGSDPVVAETLGLKKAQIEGVRDGQKDLIEQLQTDDGRMRRLAEEFLKRKNKGQLKEEVA